MARSRKAAQGADAKPAPKAAAKTSAKKKASRDVFVAPTVKQIEESIAGGKSMTLSKFSKAFKW
jgi:hypothetical protein